MRRKKLKVGVAVALLFAGLTFGVGWYVYWHVYRYYYPFGMEHRCDKQLHLALRNYAQQHEGHFPSGQATPEASLSLLGGYAYLLRRRDVPEEVVRELLEHGKLLGPETCGWNYVEGLRIDSNPDLALFWDKEGLDEMGRRLPYGGHFVSFINGPYQYIPASEWSDFLDKQQKLLAAEKANAKRR